MCRIKDVKEIFHARALLIIVSKHQGKDENHEPLSSSDASAFKHLYTELADTEEDIHNAEQIFLLLQEILSLSFCLRFLISMIQIYPFSSPL